MRRAAAWKPATAALRTPAVPLRSASSARVRIEAPGGIAFVYKVNAPPPALRRHRQVREAELLDLGRIGEVAARGVAYP